MIIYDEVGKEVVFRQKRRSSKQSRVVDVSKALHEHCLMESLPDLRNICHNLAEQTNAHRG